MAKLPFPHYEGSADAAAGAGGQAKDMQATFGALTSNLAGQNDTAANQSVGTIKSNVENITADPQEGSGKQATWALVGGGAINHFASAIRTYNGHIDDLNEQYENAKANDFGVADDAGHKEGNTDAENDDAREDLIDAARTKLEGELEEKRKGYENDLDDAADFSAAMLTAGPTRETVMALYLIGSIDPEEAAVALGTTVHGLNELRKWVGTVKGALGLKGSLASVAQWLAGKDLNKLTNGSMQKWDVLQKLRELVRTNRGTTMPFADRVAAYKTAKQALRGDALVKAAQPGNLFGKYGYVGKHAASVSKWTKFLNVTGKVGKALPPLAVLAGGYGLYDSIANWEGDGPLGGTLDDYNNVVGSTATVVSGGLGTGMMIAAAAGMAFPPAGAAIAIGAGVVALGSLAVTYRHEIADGANWVYENSGAKDVVEGVGNVVEGAGDLIDDITPW